MRALLIVFMSTMAMVLGGCGKQVPVHTVIVRPTEATKSTAARLIWKKYLGFSSRHTDICDDRSCTEYRFQERADDLIQVMRRPPDVVQVRHGSGVSVCDVPTMLHDGVLVELTFSSAEEDVCTFMHPFEGTKDEPMPTF